MKLLCPLLCFGLLGTSDTTFAQVYKSYDVDGNVVFSDKPTQNSSEVEISKPNVSDSFEVPPPSPTAPEPEAQPDTEPDPEPVSLPIAEGDPADTNNDGRVSRREKEKYREEQHRINREARKAAEGINE